MAVLLSLMATVKGGVSLGPEVPVAPPVLAEASGEQSNAVIASAGGDSLAAWFDYDRRGLYVTTIAADGKVVAPARRIYSGPASGISVCWTGSTYLVTWYDYPAGLLAIPLARDGVPTGAARLVAPAETITRSGALAWNGQHALLAYYIPPSRSAAVILDAQANVVRSDIALPDTPSQQSVVAAVGSTFYLFVRTSQLIPVSPGVNRFEDTITVLRFKSDGTPIDASATLVSRTDAMANSWGVSSDGNRLALVLVEGLSTPALRRFLIDPQTLASRSLPAISVIAPSGAVVTWNGSMFIAVWLDYGHGSTSALMTLPFSASTDGQPGAILTRDGTGSEAVATFNGRNVVAAWIEGGNGLYSDVIGVQLDPTATRTAGEPFTISTAYQWQVSPALAQSLAVWVETEGDSANDVFAALASATGFGPRVRVSASSRAMLFRPPAVAFTGDTYLVVWQESPPDVANPRLMARRLRLDGTPFDAQPILVTDHGSEPSVAFNGSTVLLSYVVSESSFGGGSFGGGEPSFVNGIRFDRSGNRVDAAPFVISVSASGSAHGPSVASNGTDFLVVWRHDPTIFCCSDPPPPPAPPPPPPPTPDILGARVTATGAVLDTQPLNIAGSADPRISPVVAPSGAGYLIGFGTQTGTVTRVLAQRLLHDGALSGAPITLGNPVSTFPFAMAIAADVTGCWISWSDGDVYLAHVGARGLDIEPAVIATGAARPAFAPGSIAYSLTDPDQTVVVVRALPAHPRRRTAGH